MATQQRILVPLDGSELAEAAVPYAEALARALGAVLHLLAVIEPQPPRIFGLDREVRTQLEFKLGQQMAEYLTTIAGGSHERGVDTATETVFGHPAEEILAVADRGAASTIVMATHGRGGVQRAFLGSVADKVMRTAIQPTLLISPREQHPGKQAMQPIALQRIAVPLDGSPDAEAALGLAGALAAAAGAEVVLVRVQSLSLTSTLPHPYIELQASVDAELEREAVQYLQGQRPRLPERVKTDIAMLRGVPVTALAEYMRAQAIDLVVMTTHGYGGAQRLLMGSTADRLVRLGLPVLLVRERGKAP